MTADNGGEAPERLAPVIPLFGRVPDPVVERAEAGSPLVVERAQDGSPAVVERAKRVETPEPAWRTTWDDDSDGGIAEGEIDEVTQIEREIAESNLTRKLRTRQLSVTEARAVVAERDLDPATIDNVLYTFTRRGYLDDRALADQLVRSAVERKGQGRTVIAQMLAKRGIPRAVVDAALADLPDDDAERALDFARQKARAMQRLEREVALRRLVGQLSRRGYGSAAMDAARQALDELAE